MSTHLIRSGYLRGKLTQNCTGMKPPGCHLAKQEKVKCKKSKNIPSVADINALFLTKLGIFDKHNIDLIVFHLHIFLFQYPTSD